MPHFHAPPTWLKAALTRKQICSSSTAIARENRAMIGATRGRRAGGDSFPIDVLKTQHTPT